MNNPTKPYYAVDKTIYFTDRVEEVLIYTFDEDDTAGTICELLNSAYDSAYQDGLNASLSRHHKELLDKLLLLTMENSRMKNLMKMNE
ncbi:hypothetical protein MKY96_26070 [Paenibacillus sp. FSL R7-0302]|uniref:hypothetical protein n=1 Tax=Paenibacillus sp. FSL R7-0302 TaxID=2921681 RepID=UPI0030F5941E